MGKAELTCSFDLMVNASTKLPKYLRETGFESPSDPRDGVIQYAVQSKLGVFDLLNSLPESLRDFNTFMGNTMGARKHWVDWYPVGERLFNGLDETHPNALLVDIGGGRGHDLTAFHNKFPG